MNKLLISFSALFLLSTSFFSYKYFSKKTNAQPVIIYPDHSATKIKPADNQNFTENNENTIYDNFKVKKASLRKINLLPEPEQPLNITAFGENSDSFKKQEQPGVIDPLDLILAEIMGNEERRSTVSEDLVLPEILEDAKDQKILSLNVSKKGEVQVVISKEEENYKNIKITKVYENNKLRNNYVLRKDNNFKIQLASVKSAIVAKTEGERIQKKFAKILGGLNITVQKIEAEKRKVFHLVFAGPFPNISKAKTACRKLNDKGQTCTVSR